MKSISLSSVIGLILSSVPLLCIFVYILGGATGYGVLALILASGAAAILSIIFSFVSLFYVFRGYRGKYLTFIALSIDIITLIIITINFS